MKKVLVLVALFTSVAALTLSAQDVKKEKEAVQTEQYCKEKKACCQADSTAAAAKPQQVKKDEGEKEK